MRTRRTPRPKKPRLSPFYATLLVAGLLIGAWFAIDFYDSRRTTITFVMDDGAVPSLELTFYPEQLAFAAPSPPPPLGARTCTGGSITVGSELVPERAVVRYRAVGDDETIGAGVAYVTLGVDAAPIVLRSPETISGRVGSAVCQWWWGWRAVAFRAIVDAEVVMMGGGEHGVDLVETRTDADGKFTLTGFDGTRGALGVRIRAKGYGIEHRHLEELRSGGPGQAIGLFEAPLRRGRLQMQTDVDPTTLTVLARNLPGVQAVPAADGTFALDHVPALVETRMLLYDLPGTCAHESVLTARDRVVDMQVVPAAIVRGTVVDVRTSRALAGAFVWVGREKPVRTRSDGSFELRSVRPGDCVLMAQWKPRRAKSRSVEPRLGRHSMLLEGGKQYDGIEITIE